MLLPGFEPSTSVSKTDILANRPIRGAVLSPDERNNDYKVFV